MANALPPEQKAAYGVIIDGILAHADLNTISAKAIRKGLQEKVDYDLMPQKQAITELIMERFDKFQRDQAHQSAAVTREPPPTLNGAVHKPIAIGVKTGQAVQAKTKENAVVKEELSVSASPKKRKASAVVDDDDASGPPSSASLSDVEVTPPPKKVRRAPEPEIKTDEELAREMQAELNRAGARSTRGGGTTKRKTVASKAARGKKKSAAKIRTTDDSEVESESGEKPEKEKKGGFHKPLNLSQPLADLLGEPQLSRPETVKRIWAYVRSRDLQDPADKRQIRCDDAMRAVFKSTKISMFAMNKVLSAHLIPIED